MSVYFVMQDFRSGKENKKPLAPTSAPTKKQRDKQKQKAKSATALEQAKTIFSFTLSSSCSEDSDVEAESEGLDKKDRFKVNPTVKPENPSY